MLRQRRYLRRRPHRKPPVPRSSGSIRFESEEKNRSWAPSLARARTKPRALAIKFKRYPRLRPWLADFALKRRWRLQALRWRPFKLSRQSVRKSIDSFPLRMGGDPTTGGQDQQQVRLEFERVSTRPYSSAGLTRHTIFIDPLAEVIYKLRRNHTFG